MNASLKQAATERSGASGGGLRRRASRPGGSALLAVFWSIMVLTLAISGWFFWLQQRVQEHGEDARGAEAMAMAYSGYAVASHPKVDRYSSLLQAEPLPGMGYRVTIESEGKKINIKVMLAQILSDEKKGLLQFSEAYKFLNRWLEEVIGVEPDARARLMDCLLDYVDGDTLTRLNGQEDSPTYHPTNRPIENLDELKRIPGLEPLTNSTGWKDSLTLLSIGPLDLMEIHEDLMILLPGFGVAQVQQVLRTRAGADQVPGTEDDRGMVSAVQKYFDGMNLTKEQKSLAKVGNEPTERWVCEGYSGKVVRQLQVVVRKSTGGTAKTQILSWIE